MAIKQLVTLPSFNGVAAGSTATLNIPPTGMYHEILIRYRENGADASVANMKAAITGVRMLINGKIQRRFNAAELFAINAVRGMAARPGVLPLYLAEPWRRSMQGEDALAWGMAGVSTFQIEIDIAAGRVSPELTARALKTFPVNSNGQPIGLGPIVKWHKYHVPVTAAGVVNFHTLNRNAGNYYALHANTADISAIEVKTDNIEQWIADRFHNDEILLQQGWNPQAGWTHMLFDHTARVSDTLDMRYAKSGQPVTDFQVNVTMSAPTTFAVIAEVVGTAD